MRLTSLIPGPRYQPYTQCGVMGDPGNRWMAYGSGSTGLDARVSPSPTGSRGRRTAGGGDEYEDTPRTPLVINENKGGGCWGRRSHRSHVTPGRENGGKGRPRRLPGMMWVHGPTVQWSWRGSGVVFPWSAMTQGGLGMVWNGLALVGIPGCPDHQGFGTDSRWSKVVREACYSDHLRPSKTTPHPGQPRTTQEWSAVHSRPPSPQTSPN